MKKRLTAFVAAVVLAVSVLSGFPMNVKAASVTTLGDSMENAVKFDKMKFYELEHVRGGAEWAYFETDAKPGYYTFKSVNKTCDGPVSLDFKLYDEELKQITLFHIYDQNGSTGEMITYSIKLEPSKKYYLSTSSSTYDNNCKFAFCVHYTKDPDSDTITEATKISLNKTKTATMADDNDVDWFKFKTSSAGEYKISGYNKQKSDVNARSALAVIVYDKDMNLVRFAVDGKEYDGFYLEQGKKYAIRMKLKKNTVYYVRVCAYDAHAYSANVNKSAYTLKVAKCK